MDHVKFLECKRLTSCNGNGCLLFDPSDENPLLCDCCTCHRSFHRVIHNIPPESGACVKKHGREVDGCQLFYPDEANARKCGCHRSLHKPQPSSHHHVHIRSHKIQLLKPFLHRKVILCSLIKLEFHVGKTNSEYIDNGVSDNLDVEMIGIPKKLKKNWKLLIKKYH